MTTIVGISGSLRRRSLNTALLRAACEAMPEGSALEIAAIDEVPLYNGDVEEAGMPASVERLKAHIRDADGLLLATPEYNNAVPGVLKNAIDWASRPPADSAGIFRGKPVACIGATPGRYGTILAQDAWLGIFRTLALRPWWGGRLMVSRADTLFDDDGKLTDADTRDALEEFMHGFVAFAAAGRTD